MTTVVVTRPAAQAESFLTLARQQGIKTLAFPAIAIEPAADDVPVRAAWARLERYRLVVFVSPNAIEHALRHLDRPWPSAVPIAVMGPGSLATLARHGIAAPAYTIFAPPQSDAPGGEPGDQHFDSQALFAQLDLVSLSGGPVLIVKGNGGRPWLADRLAESGITVEKVESYRRTLPTPDVAQEAAIRQLAIRREEAVFVVTSSEGLENLLLLLERIGGAEALDWFRTCPLVVPHRRIEENATRLGFDQVILSGVGDSNILHALK